MSRGRRGVSVVEALVALVAGLLVVQLGLVVLARQRQAQRRLTERAEGLAAVRIVRDVVGAELQRGRPDRDWTLASADSLVLRAFRGVGRVCPLFAPSPELLVAYEGVRAPDPMKDSLLLMDHGGTWTVRALLAAAPSRDSCPEAPGVPVQRWRLGGDAPPGTVLARVFERGSYHFSGGALRYRRGAGGRQPLTPEVLLTPPSGFVSDSVGVEAVLVVTAVSGATVRHWRQTLWRRSYDVPD